MGDPVVHFEIGGTDGEKTRDFYETLFGWTVESDPTTGYGMVDTGSDTGIRGGILQAPPGVPAWLTVYVAVDDLEATLARAESLGATRTVGPTPVGEAGVFALIGDPDGNPVGLFAEHGTGPGTG